MNLLWLNYLLSWSVHPFVKLQDARPLVGFVPKDGKELTYSLHTMPWALF